MEIDKLPPEVAEAIEALDAMTYAGSRTHAHWSCVKDHLDRLAEENARLARANIALIAERDHANLLQRKTESELAALKARTAEAPILVARVVVPHACDGAPYLECTDSNGGLHPDVVKRFLTPQLRRVAMLKLEDGERE